MSLCEILRRIVKQLVLEGKDDSTSREILQLWESIKQLPHLSPSKMAFVTAHD
jgi:hypothetical protein